MSIQIPESPKAFFTEFFPAQFKENRSRYPAADTPGAAVFEVIGEGAWAIRIQGGNLQVEEGKPEDTKLQIALSPDDFRAVFVDRTRGEVEKSGTLSDDSKDAFRPLFMTEKKLSIAASAQGTLAFSIEDGDTKRHVYITPGNGERGEPRTTISSNLPNFVALQAGSKSPTSLFMLGKLKIRGDMGYAMKMNGLLA